MEEHDVMFTETDFRILDSYKSVLDGLAAYLGDGYKIILHSLHDSDHLVIEIINGHYTGRREDLPITDLALFMPTKIEERSNTSCITYFSQNQKGAPLKPATTVTRNHSRMTISPLCINPYMDASVLQSLQSITPPAVQTPDSPVEESYVENVDELIVQVVTEASQRIQNDSAISNANKNKEIVSILCQRGIFSLKDAVVRVVGLMGISENAIYTHTRNFNHS